MGTNYYIAKNYCECCDRYDKEYHIGKSSSGWAFTFQGYKAERLVSWQAWKQFIKDKMIVDEYGERINSDWFVGLIEGFKSPGYVSPNGRKNLSHNEEIKKPNSNGMTWFDPEYDWDDDEGYSFSSREFS